MYSDATKFNTVTDNGVARFFDGRCENHNCHPDINYEKITILY